MPPVFVVAAAIVDDVAHPRRLLAARRSAPPEIAGQWEFPGGKVEAGEDAVTALHRELYEELGVVVRLADEVRPKVGTSWPIAQNASMRLWLAEITDGVPSPLEDHDQLRWLEFGGWRDVGWLPADVAMVEAVVALTESKGSAPSRDR
jgi:8-oxo-dGTP diphosphatase